MRYLQSIPRNPSLTPKKEMKQRPAPRNLLSRQHDFKSEGRRIVLTNARRGKGKGTHSFPLNKWALLAGLPGRERETSFNVSSWSPGYLTAP